MDARWSRAYAYEEFERIQTAIHTTESVVGQASKTMNEVEMGEAYKAVNHARLCYQHALYYQIGFCPEKPV